MMRLNNINVVFQTLTLQNREYIQAKLLIWVFQLLRDLVVYRSRRSGSSPYHGLFIHIRLLSRPAVVSAPIPLRSIG